MKNFFISLVMALGISINIHGQTFEYKDAGTNFILYDLSIPENGENIAFAGGSQFTTETAPGVIIKSEDAGETWTTVYEGDNIQTIAFVTPEKGFAAGFSQTVKRTDDGGQTWVDVNIGTDIYYCPAIRFFDENNGTILYATLNNDLEVRVTSDGGETWELSPNPPLHGIMKMNYADANTLFGVGYSGSVYKSEDGGMNWSMIRQQGMEVNLGVAFQDAENGVFAGEEGNLYVTGDGGNTWENNLYTGYHHFYGLAWKGNKILAAGTDENIYLSNENGEDFEQIFSGSGQEQPYEIGFFADNAGLIVGSGGFILKFTDLFMDTKEIQNNSTVIYPNPVKNILNLKSEKSVDQLQIFDLSGKSVFTQNNLKANTQIDVSNLPKGVYIVKINSNGEVKTQKITKK